MKMDKMVCYCAKVKVQDIADAIAQGANTVEEIQKVTKAGTCCGRCDKYFENVALDLLEEKHNI